MNHIFKLLLLVVSMAVFWCMAESFLVTEKPERRKTPAQIKQEIAESMGNLLERKIETIETIAQIQQVLCKHIRALAENDKNSEFKNAKIRDLQGILKTLHQENERCERELAVEKRFLSTLRSNMTH